MRIPASTTNVSRGSVFRSATAPRRGSPESIEAGRVDDRDPVLRGEAGARLDEARVPVGDRDGEAGRRRAHARPARARRVRTPRGRVPRRRRMRASGTTASGRSRGSAARSRALARASPGDSATRKGAKRGRSRRGRRAIDEHAVRRVLALLDRRAERVQLRQARRPPRTGSAGARAPSGRRTGRRASALQLLDPLAGRGGNLRRVGEAVREAAAAELVEAVDLVQHELRSGARRRRSRRARPRRRAPSRRAASSATERPRRAGRGRRRASPRASTRSPRRAGAAGGG